MAQLRISPGPVGCRSPFVTQDDGPSSPGKGSGQEAYNRLRHRGRRAPEGPRQRGSPSIDVTRRGVVGASGRPASGQSSRGFPDPPSPAGGEHGEHFPSEGERRGGSWPRRWSADPLLVHPLDLSLFRKGPGPTGFLGAPSSRPSTDGKIASRSTYSLTRADFYAPQKAVRPTRRGTLGRE